MFLGGTQNHNLQCGFFWRNGCSPAWVWWHKWGIWAATYMSTMQGHYASVKLGNVECVTNEKYTLRAEEDPAFDFRQWKWLLMKVAVPITTVRVIYMIHQDHTEMNARANAIATHKKPNNGESDSLPDAAWDSVFRMITAVTIPQCKENGLL